MVSQAEAHRRAVEDFSQFAQYTRMAAQAAFAANGGAALAILSALITLSSEPDSAALGKRLMEDYLPFSAAFFLTGVFAVIAAVLALGAAKRLFGGMWQRRTETPSSKPDPLARAANLLERLGYLSLALAAVSFLIGSGYTVVGFAS